jgi:hypothetical protein
MVAASFAGGLVRRLQFDAIDTSSRNLDFSSVQKIDAILWIFLKKPETCTDFQRSIPWFS